MPKFKYVVRNSAGKVTSGTLEAKDHTELRRILRVNDLYLTRYRQAGRVEGDPSATQQSYFARVRARDIVILVRQLATLVRAGVPLTEGLTTLEAQADKPQLKFALKHLRDEVTEGRSLSSAMSGFPKLFNTLTISLVEAGEGTGTLDQSLDVAAEQLDREENLRSRVRAAMVYPKLVVVAAVGTVALMLTLVVPTFKVVYTQFHGTLPGATMALIAISNFTVQLWWAIALAIAAIWVGFIQYKKTAAGARAIDRIVLKIPVVGQVLRKVAIARFTQTLATGLKGGVPVLRSILLAAQTAGNTVIRDVAIATIARVREGEPIADELQRSNEFPLMVTQMIRSGESTGSLDHMLDEINRYYEEDIDYAIDKMTKLIEPAMTIMVGGIVLFVLLALYMPIFNLGKTVLGNK